MLARRFFTTTILTSIILVVLFFSTINIFKSNADNHLSSLNSLVSPQLTSCGLNPNFAATESFTTPDKNKDIATGDFNKDGRIDLVTVSEEGGMSIILRTLSGSYEYGLVEAPVGVLPIAPGSTPTSVAVADFNRDGNLDIIVVLGYLNKVRTFLGRGNGIFDIGSDFSVASGPQHIEIADFNNDSRPDFAVVGTTTFTVGVNSATNPGTFTTNTVTHGLNSVYLLPGDFNSDGKVDILISRFGSNSVRLFPGNGTGIFTTVGVTAIVVGQAPWGSIAGDFNKDGKLDVAVVSNSNDTVSILLGTGSGLSTTPITLQTIDDPVDITVGDFNSDSNLDLAITGYNSNTVQVRMGDGTGNFSTTANYTTSAQPYAIVAGRFTEDGNIDIITANHDGNNLSIIKNNCCAPLVLEPATLQNATAGDYYYQPLNIEGGGKFTYLVTAGALPPGLQISNDYAGGLLSGVVNQSGTYNFTITVPQAGCANTSQNYTMVVATPVDNFGFNYGHSITAGSTPSNAITAELDNNGSLDLIVSNSGSNNISTFVGNGQGALTPYETVATGAGPVGLATGDFNEDGRTDIVTANAAGKNISVIFGKASLVINGSGSLSNFYPAVNYGLSNTVNAVVVGDFNQDGHQDLAVAVDGKKILFTSTNAFVQIMNGDGTGKFTNAGRIEITLAVTQIKSLAVGDFNQDGRQDIAIANFNNDNVTIALATGPNTFSKSLVGVGAGPNCVRIGDFNKDGKQDIVTANTNAGNISVALGNGNGTFGAASNISLGNGSAPASVELMEINNDGKVDLLVTFPASGGVGMLFGSGTGSFQPFSYPLLPQAPGARATAIGDFDGDHIADVAIPTNNNNNVELVYSKF